jgi:hypothetical protein
MSFKKRLFTSVKRVNAFRVIQILWKIEIFLRN